MLGQPVPDFSLPATGGAMFRLSGARGTKRVLYFCPKGNTLKSHESFKAKMKFPFELLSDAEEKGHVEEVLNFVKAL